MNPLNLADVIRKAVAAEVATQFAAVKSRIEDHATITAREPLDESALIERIKAQLPTPSTAPATLDESEVSRIVEKVKADIHAELAAGLDSLYSVPSMDSVVSHVEPVHMPDHVEAVPDYSAPVVSNPVASFTTE